MMMMINSRISWFYLVYNPRKLHLNIALLAIPSNSLLLVTRAILTHYYQNYLLHLSQIYIYIRNPQGSCFVLGAYLEFFFSPSTITQNAPEICTLPQLLPPDYHLLAELTICTELGHHRRFPGLSDK